MDGVGEVGVVVVDWVGASQVVVGGGQQVGVGGHHHRLSIPPLPLHLRLLHLHHVLLSSVLGHDLSSHHRYLTIVQYNQTNLLLNLQEVSPGSCDLHIG